MNAYLYPLAVHCLLIFPLCLVGTAAAEGYTPPPLSSADALVNSPPDNGYGLGALIKSQHQQGRSENSSKELVDREYGAAPATESVAAAAARQAQSARRQARGLQAEIGRLEAQLAASQSALAVLRAKSEGGLTDLTTPAGQQNYVVGQSIAANLRDRLQSYTNAGLTLDKLGVLAGINDGLKGNMQMKKVDMDVAYRQFASKLQQQVSKQVSTGEALIAQKSRGRTPVKQVDGIIYFVVKKGKTITDPDAPVMLSLTEAITDGRTLSQLPQLVLTVTDEMPTVVREALPLLGEGSEVQAYALAKSVYGSRPLPHGIEAFTVLTYDLKGLTPLRHAKK